LDTPKGLRPDPSTYISKSAIEAHLKPFENGAVRMQPSVQTGTIGRTETWVFPKSLGDDAAKQANGDPRKLEKLLGIEDGYLGANPIRVDIPNPKNTRIPTGNEFGANNLWRPGGYTYPGKMPEAIIDPVPAGSYTSQPAF
jgi:filamentous hemagglutinin